MKKEALAILLGFLDNQMALIQRIIKDIQLTTPDSREKVSQSSGLLAP